LSKALGDLIRVVAASIFHDNDFGRKRLLFKKSKHLLQRAGQAVFFIMGWNNDRKKWIQVFIE
jgi:hypothetical protein